MAARVRQPPITPINPIWKEREKKKKNLAHQKSRSISATTASVWGSWVGSQIRPPARLSRKQHAGISAGRRGARAPSVGTLTLIQHDLLIYFHGGNDVNDSILMPVCMEIWRNINASGRWSCRGWSTLICIEQARVYMSMDACEVTNNRSSFMFISLVLN